MCELRLSSCFLHFSGTQIRSFPERVPGSHEKPRRIISSGNSRGLNPSHWNNNNDLSSGQWFMCRAHDGFFMAQVSLLRASFCCSDQLHVFSDKYSSIDCFECLDYAGIMCVLRSWGLRGVFNVQCSPFSGFHCVFLHKHGNNCTLVCTKWVCCAQCLYIYIYEDFKCKSL